MRNLPADIKPRTLVVAGIGLIGIGIVAGALLGPKLAPKIFIEDGYTSDRNTSAPIYEGQEINRPPQGLIHPTNTACIQVITPARNGTTGEVRDFPTPCDVPEGWEKVSN
ncbi:MAG: hypothetical protein KBD66_03410 [Candidatus Doudnabacteria bacterium]|nr:hypothetical protein [Candidatus Doudnabacteria bacterium]